MERVALITGGGSGIGLATAHALQSAGHKAVVTGRNEDKLKATGFDYTVMDVTDETSVDHALSEIGPVDILVCNAGAAMTSPALKMSTSDWQSMLNVNLTGIFLCARRAIPEMIEQKWGRLVVVASTSSFKAYPYTAGYAAAKHGAVGLMRSLALELARTGVTSNAVCPGFTDTDILTKSIDTIVSKTGRTRDEALAALVKDNPMRRAIHPDEVAATITWLCSDLARSVNGTAIPVDGGELAA